MKTNKFILAGMAILMVVGFGAASAQTVLTSTDAAKVLKVEQLNAGADRISGVIANASPHTVRNVLLLVEYHWLWNNERHPGQDSPGRTETIRIDKELAAGASTPFSYTPSPPLARRSDGQFMPEVVVGGFTVVVQPSRTAQK